MQDEGLCRQEHARRIVETGEWILGKLLELLFRCSNISNPFREEWSQSGMMGFHFCGIKENMNSDHLAGDLGLIRH